MSALRLFPPDQASRFAWFVCDPSDAASTMRGYYVIDDFGMLARSDWDSRYFSLANADLHEYDDEAMRAYWPASMLQQPPAPPKHTVVIGPEAAREFARIQAKLERWELQHLRTLAAEQAERIEQLEQQLAAADDSAEFWRDAHHSLADHLDADTADGRCIGLTKDGALLVVRAGGAA